MQEISPENKIKLASLYASYMVLENSSAARDYLRAPSAYAEFTYLRKQLGLEYREAIDLAWNVHMYEYEQLAGK